MEIKKTKGNLSIKWFEYIFILIFSFRFVHLFQYILLFMFLTRYIHSIYNKLPYFSLHFSIFICFCRWFISFFFHIFIPYFFLFGFFHHLILPFCLCFSFYERNHYTGQQKAPTCAHTYTHVHSRKLSHFTWWLGGNSPQEVQRECCRRLHSHILRLENISRTFQDSSVSLKVVSVKIFHTYDLFIKCLFIY